eukprot:278800-Prymnesium_polylepis.1
MYRRVGSRLVSDAQPIAGDGILHEAEELDDVLAVAHARLLVLLCKRRASRSWEAWGGQAE